MNQKTAKKISQKMIITLLDRHLKTPISSLGRDTVSMHFSELSLEDVDFEKVYAEFEAFVWKLEDRYEKSRNR